MIVDELIAALQALPPERRALPVTTMLGGDAHIIVSCVQIRQTIMADNGKPYLEECALDAESWKWSGHTDEYVVIS